MISPDGRWLAFSDAGAGRNQLWLRALDSTLPRRLGGTEGGTSPFWSPDSRSLGFFAEGQLKVLDIAGGPPRVLCPVQQSRGGSWNRNGEIIFTPTLGGPIQRISAAGGSPTPVTRIDEAQGEQTHRWPYFLRDGRHFLYFTRSSRPGLDGVYLGSLDGAPPRRLVASSTNAVYAPPGFLLFVRDGALIAQEFDAKNLSLSPNGRALVEQVGYALQLNRASISVSDTGVLTYGGVETTEPVWFDLKGVRGASLGNEHYHAQLWLSPDGKRVALDRPDEQSGANDIVIVDVERPRVSTKLTLDAGSDVRPVWSATTVWHGLRIGKDSTTSFPEAFPAVRWTSCCWPRPNTSTYRLCLATSAGFSSNRSPRHRVRTSGCCRSIRRDSPAAYLATAHRNATRGLRPMVAGLPT